MLSSQKQASFKRIFKWFQDVETIFGVSMFEDPIKKESILKKMMYTTIYRHNVMFAILFCSTLTSTNFKLISIIMCCSLSAAVIGGYVAVSIVISKQDTLKNLIGWCEGLYDVEKKYHKIIQGLAAKELILIEKRTTKMLQWMTRIFFFDAITLTLGSAIIGTFLPENMYPKYSLPVPFYLPFNNQKTWLACIITVLFQTTVAIDTAILGLFIYGYMFSSYIQILGFLDIIQKTTETMKYEMVLDTQQYDMTPKSNLKQRLHLDTLATINADSPASYLTINQWAQILTDMISDVSFAISTSNNIFKVHFLLNELAALGSLFICGLLFTVVHQQYYFAVGIVIACVLLFINCYVNEQILEKLQNINETIYDVPWYYLKPKQRKVLMILMHCNVIQNGFKSAGIHDLTLEHFGVIVKAGYTNLLVLKDLVMK